MGLYICVEGRNDSPTAIDGEGGREGVWREGRCRGRERNG